MAWPVTMFRLVSEPTEAGLCCRSDGLTLAGISLLRHGGLGFEPRPLSELQDILDAAYGAQSGILAASRFNGLLTVAQALNDGDLNHATLASLFLNLPDINANGVARLTDLAKFDKANFRVDENRDRHGRWSTDGNLIPAQAIPFELPFTPELVRPFGIPRTLPAPPLAPNASRNDRLPSSDDNFPEECRGVRRKSRERCTEWEEDGILGKPDNRLGRFWDECFRGQVPELCGGNEI